MTFIQFILLVNSIFYSYYTPYHIISYHIFYHYRNLSRRNWPNLTELDISFNKLDNKGITEIIAGVKRCDKLQILHLAGCQLKPGIFSAFSEYIASNPSITDLNLAFNLLSAIGGEVRKYGIHADYASLPTTVSISIIKTVLSTVSQNNPLILYSNKHLGRSKTSIILS